MQILIYVTSAVLVAVVRIAKGVILLIVPKALIMERAGLVTHGVLNILLNGGLVYIVMTLAVANCVHLLSVVNRRRQFGTDNSSAIVESLRQNVLPHVEFGPIGQWENAHRLASAELGVEQVP